MAATGEGRVEPPSLEGTVKGAVAAPGEGKVDPPLEGTVEGAVAAPGEGRVCPVWESVQVKHERSVGVDRYHVDR